AVDKFCKEDVPSFMVDMCEKVIEKNLEFIIEKLKDHEPADKICTDIFLCRAEKTEKSTQKVLFLFGRFVVNFFRFRFC
uniref:Saposin B-type domain-containing protein n=1 Tax=Caenorhabditis japonica TaxID=281687 RepID=A0A8R1EF10_CAEJA